WVVYGAYVRAQLRGPLIRALKQRDSAAACSLLARGADPNSRDMIEAQPSGFALLLWWWNHRNQPERGKTALMLAAGNEDLRSVRDLLARAADVNARDESRCTALLDAASATGWVVSYDDKPAPFALPTCEVLKALLD